LRYWSGPQLRNQARSRVRPLTLAIGIGVSSATVIGRLSYWRHRAVTVAAEERRRAARDLHDGLAQELAFIVGQSRALLRSEPAESPALREIAAAAERALRESRRVIGELTEPVGQTLAEAIAMAAEQVAARAGSEVRLHLEDVQVPPHVRTEFSRIVREAVFNAVQHGRAGVIEIELTKAGRVRLLVRDDGDGFDVAAGLRKGGLGLRSMHERSRLLGAKLQVRSWPGHGAEVEVVL
jgi:signal transduction histidine kinase